MQYSGDDDTRIETQLALADRMVSVGTLAAGVAHEISNPLTYALHNLDRLAEELPKLHAQLVLLAAEVPAVGHLTGPLLDAAAGLEDRAARAAEGLGRVRSIVRGLKTFSRIDEEAPAPVGVLPALEAALSMAQNELKYRARLVRELAPTPPVLANTGRLSQVFLNLLVNAAQAIGDGRVNENEIRVRSYQREGEVCVEVEDTGPGIPPEHLPRLFEPFFTTKPAGVGSGLGLPISQRIVVSFGGRLDVESAPGRGSLFRVVLPACLSPATSPPEGCGAEPAPAAPRSRILIVDDEPNIRLTLESLLGADHEVQMAASGAEARDAVLRGARPDVVLCDLMMPEVSGMDFFAWLSAHDPGLARRVVFMTGGAFTPTARAFLEGVDNRCIEKPFRFDHLAAVLREVLER